MKHMALTLSLQSVIDYDMIGTGFHRFAVALLLDLYSPKARCLLCFSGLPH